MNIYGHISYIIIHVCEYLCVFMYVYTYLYIFINEKFFTGKDFKNERKNSFINYSIYHIKITNWMQSKTNKTVDRKDKFLKLNKFSLRIDSHITSIKIICEY